MPSTGYVLSDNGSALIPSTSGVGIKTNPASPSYMWKDLIGNIGLRGGGSDPAMNTYRGNVRQYQFAVNDEMQMVFHMPHDWVPGTDLYIHIHSSHTATTITGGTFDFTFEFLFAKGFNQSAFSAPVTSATIACPASTTQYQHQVTEIQITASSPSVNQINNSVIEVDGLLIGRLKFTANNSTISGGAPVLPFVHAVDIHYQSTNIGTKNKAPNFYT